VFTGLINSVGTVREITRSATPRIIVECPLASELKRGDSIAVSGVCLTAIDIDRDSFSADLAKETLERTGLAQLSSGSSVNLELPARADSRLDGHIVQGHVDGTARLVGLQKTQGDDWRMVLELSEGLETGVVAQGSITVEGISLTVAKIDGRMVEIAVIPHTYEATNLKVLKPGARLNIELDVLAKYAEKRSERRFTLEELIALGF
jgi:riboflavin synthase